MSFDLRAVMNSVPGIGGIDINALLDTLPNKGSFDVGEMFDSMPELKGSSQFVLIDLAQEDVSQLYDLLKAYLEPFWFYYPFMNLSPSITKKSIVVKGKKYDYVYLDMDYGTFRSDSRIVHQILYKFSKQPSLPSTVFIHPADTIFGDAIFMCGNDVNLEWGHWSNDRKLSVWLGWIHKGNAIVLERLSRVKSTKLEEAITQLCQENYRIDNGITTRYVESITDHGDDFRLSRIHNIKIKLPATVRHRILCNAWLAGVCIAAVAQDALPLDTPLKIVPKDDEEIETEICVSDDALVIAANYQFWGYPEKKKSSDLRQGVREPQAYLGNPETLSKLIVLGFDTIYKPAGEEPYQELSHNRSSNIQNALIERGDLNSTVEPHYEILKSHCLKSQCLDKIYKSIAMMRGVPSDALIGDVILGNGQRAPIPDCTVEEASVKVLAAIRKLDTDPRGNMDDVEKGIVSFFDDWMLPNTGDARYMHMGARKEEFIFNSVSMVKFQFGEYASVVVEKELRRGLEEARQRKEFEAEAKKAKKQAKKQKKAKKQNEISSRSATNQASASQSAQDIEMAKYDNDSDYHSDGSEWNDAETKNNYHAMLESDIILVIEDPLDEDDVMGVDKA
ncbi:uncharacterized protein RJT20DRAFT_134434 [Scheffersomyces xylosifermentans]|uniref:uncharacterized protein n=1 Tax=Scheffersomyces xylosifermentans TaxID=1304137 RepID=UPI00315DF4C1